MPRSSRFHKPDYVFIGLFALIVFIGLFMLSSVSTAVAFHKFKLIGRDYANVRSSRKSAA